MRWARRSGRPARAAFTARRVMGPGAWGSRIAVVAALAAAGANPAAAQAPASGTKPALRVCADPNNLPFSNHRQQGFENRIAELIAHDLGTTVTYEWRPQR